MSAGCLKRRPVGVDAESGIPVNVESSGHVDAGQEGTTGSETSPDTADGAKELADEMDKRYEPGSRETVTVPGTGGTVAGTAFADHVTEMSDEKVENLDEQFSEFQARVDDKHHED
ncbi:hypothetical protein ACQR36_21640 [Rhodococcus erythropolis]|uniref:hypothetical protein n=1 Tax=Rhodococcus erythropolis TaxID=1833 RepID=UPI0034678771